MSFEFPKFFKVWLSREKRHKEVVSALIMKEGEVLLMRRSQHETFPGAYELPGGTVEEGESHKKTLAREILEETGLQTITVGELLGTSNFSSQSNVYARNFVYLTEIEKGIVTLSNEHDDYCFINPEEAYKLLLSENAQRALLMLAERD